MAFKIHTETCQKYKERIIINKMYINERHKSTPKKVNFKTSINMINYNIESEIVIILYLGINRNKLIKFIQIKKYRYIELFNEIETIFYLQTYIHTTKKVSEV